MFVYVNLKTCRDDIIEDRISEIAGGLCLLNNLKIHWWFVKIKGSSNHWNQFEIKVSWTEPIIDDFY